MKKDKAQQNLRITVAVSNEIAPRLAAAAERVGSTPALFTNKCLEACLDAIDSPSPTYKIQMVEVSRKLIYGAVRGPLSVLFRAMVEPLLTVGGSTLLGKPVRGGEWFEISDIVTQALEFFWPDDPSLPSIRAYNGVVDEISLKWLDGKRHQDDFLPLKVKLSDEQQSAVASAMARILVHLESKDGAQSSSNR